MNISTAYYGYLTLITKNNKFHTYSGTPEQIEKLQLYIKGELEV